ncbi:hypothetical protein [Lentzea tibetensis]|nr:hypothetical protein [Lentzea tibetensis]
MLAQSGFFFVLLSFPLWVMVFTAVWARSPRRRADALKVLRVVLRKP